jgi:hypothetical protein
MGFTETHLWNRSEPFERARIVLTVSMHIVSISHKDIIRPFIVGERQKNLARFDSLFGGKNEFETLDANQMNKRVRSKDVLPTLIGCDRAGGVHGTGNEKIVDGIGA